MAQPTPPDDCDVLTDFAGALGAGVSGRTAIWMIRLCEKTNQQVAAGAIVEDGRWLGALHDELRARLAPVFAQVRPRLAAFAYLARC
jgi:hypothetical protein